MSKIHELDSETICYIIDNEITSEAYEKILFENRLKHSNSLGIHNN